MTDKLTKELKVEILTHLEIVLKKGNCFMCNEIESFMYDNYIEKWTIPFNLAKIKELNERRPFYIKEGCCWGGKSNSNIESWVSRIKAVRESLKELQS